jgi:hypothetical protein
MFRIALRIRREFDFKIWGYSSINVCVCEFTIKSSTIINLTPIEFIIQQQQHSFEVHKCDKRGKKKSS